MAVSRDAVIVQALTWRKSSSSAEGANCVNVAIAPDGTVHLRDSKALRTVVAISPHALHHFIGAVIAGTLERTRPQQFR